jgi:PAS domain S-box-containing protein
MRVLAIEDDAVYVSLLQYHADRAGRGSIELECIPLFAKGMAKLAEEHYDVVLLDMQLPDSRGSGTVVALRSQFPSVPVVVLTSTDNEQLAAEVYDSGVQEYLVKGKTSVAGTIRSLCKVFERKLVEDRMRWLESAIHSASEAIILTENVTRDGFGPRIAFVNEGFCRLTGYMPAEAVGKTMDQFAGMRTNREELDRVRVAFQKVEPATVQLIQYRKDGSPYWAELDLKPVPDERGYLSHWVIRQDDITEKKRAEKASTATTSDEDGRRILETCRELKALVASTGARLKELHTGSQEQAAILQSLCDEHHQALNKINDVIKEEEL